GTTTKAATPGGALAVTKLVGNYTNSTAAAPISTSLKTPVLDFTGVTGPLLQFDHFYQTAAGADGGNIKISTNGGASFVVVAGSNFVPGTRAYTGNLAASTANPNGGEAAWSGTNAAFETVQIDLEKVFTAQLANAPRTQVVLAFSFGADTATNNLGWFVDIVQIGSPAAFTPAAATFASTPPTIANATTAYTYTAVATGTPPPVY